MVWCSWWDWMCNCICLHKFWFQLWTPSLYSVYACQLEFYSRLYYKQTTNYCPLITVRRVIFVSKQETTTIVIYKFLLANRPRISAELNRPLLSMHETVDSIEDGSRCSKTKTPRSGWFAVGFVVRTQELMDESHVLVSRRNYSRNSLIKRRSM